MGSIVPANMGCAEPHPGMQSPEQLMVFTPRAAPKTPAGLYLHAFKFHQHAHPYTRSSSTSTHAQPYTHSSSTSTRSHTRAQAPPARTRSHTRTCMRGTVASPSPPTFGMQQLLTNSSTGCKAQTERLTTTHWPHWLPRTTQRKAHHQSLSCYSAP
jgi:hypothetical protein